MTHTVQHDEIKRLEASMHRLKGWAKLNDKFANRAEDMVKRIERARQEAVDKPILTRDKIKVNLDADRSGKKVLEVKGLSKSYERRHLE